MIEQKLRVTAANQRLATSAWESTAGMNSRTRKLDESQVRAIYAAFHTDKKSQRAIAREFGISAANVNAICTRKRWAHLLPKETADQ